MTVAGKPGGPPEGRVPGGPAPGAPTLRPSIPDDATIIAASPSMRRAVERARAFAGTSLPILLVGPTGTGKEVLAQAIHRWSGRSGTLVDVDCGTLSAGTVINELFGHRRGSYTGAVDSVPGLLEQAHGGTLFLDELGSLPPEGQAVLLRTLETGELRRVGETAKRRVSVRVIAAMQHLPGAGAEPVIRADLLHRLGGGIIQLLPLCQRPEELMPLAQRFAEEQGRYLRAEVSAVLAAYWWPGNIRELRHVIARALTLQPEGLVEAAAVVEAVDAGALLESPPPLSAAVRERERASFLDLCRAHGGRAEAIAAAIGVSRATVYRRLQQHGIRLGAMRPEDDGGRGASLTLS